MDELKSQFTKFNVCHLRMKCEMVVVMKAWKKLKLIGRKNMQPISVADSMAYWLIQRRRNLRRPIVRGFESLEQHGMLWKLKISGTVHW